MSPTRRRTPRLIDPLRFPGDADDGARTKRAWYVLVLSALFPGSAQLVAGNRRLARIGLCATGVVWVGGLALLIASVASPSVLLEWGTRSLPLTVLTVIAAGFTLIWLICLLDTIRLIRFVGLSRRVRGGVATATVAVLVIGGGGLAYGTSAINSQRELIGGIFGTGAEVDPVDGRYNIVLLGSDAGDGREGIRPDSISVASIDADSGQTVIFGLPRNLQNVPFPEGSPLASVHPDGYSCGDECLLNGVYLQGTENAELFSGVQDPGAQAMIDASSAITGLEVQFYAMIDLDGFEELIDAMGGLTIDSLKRVPKTAKPRGTGEPEKGWIEAGEQAMDGDTALWFARSRRDTTDYERMERQRCVQEAMLAQLDPATLLTRFQSIAAAAPDMVSTDIPEGQLSGFAELVPEARQREVIKTAFVPPEVAPAQPDFGAIHQMVEDAITESDAASEEDPEARGGEDSPGGPLAGPGLRAQAQTAAASAPASAVAAGSVAEGEDAPVCTVP